MGIACAIMRCHGASQSRLVRLYLLQFIVLGAVASLAGCFAGFVAQHALALWLGSLVTVELPGAGWMPALHGFVTGLALLLGFALPPVIALAKVPTLRVLRRDIGAPSGMGLLGYALGAVVILEAPAALAPLLKPLAGVTEFVAQGEALPSFDFHCPLLSLPLAFGTTLDSLSGKPYLVAPPKRITDWTRALGKASQPRVGLAWSGNANVSNDHNRAIPLSRFSQGLPSGIEIVQHG